MSDLEVEFTIEIDIDLPRLLTVDRFANPKYYSEWQNKFTGYELLAKSQMDAADNLNLEYDFGGQNVKIIRTVMSDNLPEMNVVRYEIQGILCLIENRFNIISANVCQWVSTIKINSINEVYKDNFDVIVKFFIQYFKELQVSFKKYAESI